MSSRDEVQLFLSAWEAEADKTVRVLESLPNDQYDFRPDAAGRSLGELAWHLSEIDACLSYGVEIGRFRFEDDPPDLKRPKEVALLAPGYRRIHNAATARLQHVAGEDLDAEVTYFDGRHMTLRELLWHFLLAHMVHHRAQLVMLSRMAGGTPPGLYGPNREEMRDIQQRASAAHA